MKRCANRINSRFKMLKQAASKDSLTSAILAKYGVLTKVGVLSLTSTTIRKNNFDV